MKQFYFVADWGAKHYLRVPNVMLSSSSIWHPKTNRFNLSRTKLPEEVKRVILDSGGYVFFSKYGEYQYTLEEYRSLIYYVRDTTPLIKVSTLDYPCETKINRSQILSNEDRIKRTVERAVECIDSDSSIPWMPVIQGYTIKEYLNCISLYEDVGIKADYWAIGSICSRKGNPLQIRRIITKIREAMPNVRLHAFGLSLSYLKDPQIFNAIYSSDSAAWVWGAYSRSEKPAMIRKQLSKIALLMDNGLQTVLTQERAL